MKSNKSKSEKLKMITKVCNQWNYGITELNGGFLIVKDRPVFIYVKNLSKFEF